MHNTSCLITLECYDGDQDYHNVWLLMEVNGCFGFYFYVIVQVLAGQSVLSPSADFTMNYILCVVERFAMTCTVWVSGIYYFWPTVVRAYSTQTSNYQFCLSSNAVG